MAVILHPAAQAQAEPGPLRGGRAACAAEPAAQQPAGQAQQGGAHSLAGSCSPGSCCFASSWCRPGACSRSAAGAQRVCRATERLGRRPAAAARLARTGQGANHQGGHPSVCYRPESSRAAGWLYLASNRTAAAAVRIAAEAGAHHRPGAAAASTVPGRAHGRRCGQPCSPSTNHTCSSSHACGTRCLRASAIGQNRRILCVSGSARQQQRQRGHSRRGHLRQCGRGPPSQPQGKPVA